MDKPRIETMATERMKDRKTHAAREPGFILYHGERVAKLALALNQSEAAGVDPELLFAGALCHDIGKGEEPHHEVGAHMLASTLPDCGCSDTETDVICEMVRNHNRRHEPEACSPAARLVQDADVLDHAGTIGIWLSISWAADQDQSIEAAIAHHHDEATTRFHDALRTCLNFPTARHALEQRLTTQHRFFDDLQRHHAGSLF